MKDSLKSKLKKSDLLFSLFYWHNMRKSDNPDRNYYRIVRAAFDREDNTNMVMIHHYGAELPDRIVYDVSSGERHESVGMGAELHHLLYGLRFADFLGAVPRVSWGDRFVYHDDGMNGTTRNAFEYYFEPVSPLADQPLTDFRNVVVYERSHVKLFHDMAKYSYKLADSDIAVLADQYAKSIHPNKATRKFIDEGLSRAVGGKRMLGVHVRGTDFNVGLRNHPKIVAKEDYISAVKAEFNRGGGGSTTACSSPRTTSRRSRCSARSSGIGCSSTTMCSAWRGMWARTPRRATARSTATGWGWKYSGICTP